MVGDAGRYWSSVVRASRVVLSTLLLQLLERPPGVRGDG